jgi:hypothetical protein
MAFPRRGTAGAQGQGGRPHQRHGHAAQRAAGHEKTGKGRIPSKIAGKAQKPAPRSSASRDTFADRRLPKTGSRP